MEIKITLLSDVMPCTLVTNLSEYPAAFFIHGLSSVSLLCRWRQHVLQNFATIFTTTWHCIMGDSILSNKEVKTVNISYVCINLLLNVSAFVESHHQAK
jgi:hypothetical protein